MSTCLSHLPPERGPLLSGAPVSEGNDWATLLQGCFEPDEPDLLDDILADLDGWVFIEDEADDADG